RDASSGTTPPHSRWIGTCEAITFDRMAHGFAASPVSSTTAAEVSSHEVSMPRIFNLLFFVRENHNSARSAQDSRGIGRAPGITQQRARQGLATDDARELHRPGRRVRLPHAR